MKKEVDLSFIDQIEEFGAISPVVMQIITLLNNPDAPVRPIVERIELDAGMASFLLKFCNSALFPVKVEVNTVSHALNMLGIPRTKAILLSYFFKHVHDESRKKYIGSYLWEHSVNTAFIARELAVHLNAKDIADEAYMAGLLHDIGKLVIYFHDPQRYEQLLLEADSNRKPLLPIEMDTYHFSHAEAGHYLLNKWEFSDILKDSVRCHHDINPKARERVVNFATFANSTTHFAIDRQEELPKTFLKFYGLSEKKYEKVLDEILGLVIEARLMHLE
jgi:putative nucleotidyltransferase with HDIG domain